MTSPWPAVEAHRNKLHRLHQTGLVFGFYQCSECMRWFQSERQEGAPEPGECPLHDDAARKREERGRELGLKRRGAR